MPSFITKLLQTKLSPIQLLVIGFLILLFFGSIILTLPFSTANGEYNSFIDALFTATSAISTTGLIVVDTGSFYSLTGQIVILILIQIGGLGYMLFIVLIILGFGDRLSISSRRILRESLSRPSDVEMIKFIKIITIMTLTIEAVGAVGLMLYWLNFQSFDKAFYSGIFHSISAFCTAGFSLHYDSFVSYKQSWYINFLISTISILGGLGFPVLYDSYLFLRKRIFSGTSRFSVHSKIVLTMTFSLIIPGIVLFWFSYGYYAFDSFESAFLDSTFQIISASTTTGFNSIDIGLINNAGLFIIILLMFIGASPGSTAGGIKTTTFGTICKSMIAGLKGTTSINFFKRKLKDETVHKSILIAELAMTWVIISALILSITEEFDFIKMLFETVSAFGTVGLSTGITGQLSTAGKLVITLTMFIGRVGPLAFGLSLVARKKVNGAYFAETEIIVG